MADVPSQTTRKKMREARCMDRCRSCCSRTAVESNALLCLACKDDIAQARGRLGVADRVGTSLQPKKLKWIETETKEMLKPNSKT